jgi:hypothetical protein
MSITDVKDMLLKMQADASEQMQKTTGESQAFNAGRKSAVDAVIALFDDTSQPAT